MRTKTMEAGCQVIEALDLSAVKRKIMEPQPEGKGWTQAQADEAERWYRRYLELCLRYPEVPVVPNYPIDSMWHQHILDTRAYATDCQAIFGEMLHHYPYYGLNGDADQRDASFDETNALYREHFGEDCLDMKMFSQGGEDAEACMDRAGKTQCGKGPAPKCKAMGCHDTPCRQGYRRAKVRSSLMASGCGDKGSGTGCRQGCTRGG